MHTTAPNIGAGAACRPEQYEPADHSIAKLIAACTYQKTQPSLERSRWGELELCREALRKRDYTTARKRYEALLKKSHKHGNSRMAAKAMCDLAYLKRILGETAEANALYKAAYKEWKGIIAQVHSTAILDYIHCLLDYGTFLRKAGRVEDALKLETRVEQINPQTLNPYFAISRADLLEARGQDREAAEYYEQALLDVTMKHDIDLQLRILNKLTPLYCRLNQLQLADNMTYRKQALKQALHARFR